MLYEISCNIGSRYNGIPLYKLDIYIMHYGCDIANQMFSNGQLWTWPLIFEICWTKLLSLVVYIWSYLWFSFQVCSSQWVYFFTKWTAWGLALMKTTGAQEQDWSCDEVIKTPGLKRLEHLNLNLNTVNWWILTGRDDVTKRRSSRASDFN